MVIQPSVGRKVWFYRSVGDAQNPNVQPLDATVVYVLSDRQVNLRVSDTNGDQTPKLAVQLYQEGDEDPKSEFCCWMPYQSDQAKKAQAQERQNTQGAIDSLVSRLAVLEQEVKELKSLQLNKVAPPPGESSSKDIPVPQAASSGSSTTKLPSEVVSAAAVAQAGQVQPTAKQVTK